MFPSQIRNFFFNYSNLNPHLVMVSLSTWHDPDSSFKTMKEYYRFSWPIGKLIRNCVEKNILFKLAQFPRWGFLTVQQYRILSRVKHACTYFSMKKPLMAVWLLSWWFQPIAFYDFKLFCRKNRGYLVEQTWKTKYWESSLIGSY